MENTEEKQRGSPKLTYDELFGAPALDPEPEQKSPYEVGNPSDDPDPPRLLGVSEPAREAFKALFPVAYRYASDHFQVMIGVRKSLKRGHKTAERAGGLEV